jgi:hypothetical protein
MTEAERKMLQCLRATRIVLADLIGEVPMLDDEWEHGHGELAEIDAILLAYDQQFRMPPTALAYAEGHHDTDPDGLG